MTHRVVLATRNAGKLAELRRIGTAAAPDIQVLGLSDVAAYPEPAETERTFEGNALLKARACVAATGQRGGLEPAPAMRRTMPCCCASWRTSRRPSGLRGSSVRWRWC
jgi:hypothetical protein